MRGTLCARQPFSTDSDATNRGLSWPGFAFDPVTSAWFPEVHTAVAHPRDILGEKIHKSLARTGEGMTTAAMATHVFDQIDQARAELNAVSK
jgi:hypothetical protein